MVFFGYLSDMEDQEHEREIINDLPEGWSVRYFDPTDPDYHVEYVNAPYLLRVTGGGHDFNLQMHKGNYIEENINIIDLPHANAYAMKLMQSVSDMPSIEESYAKTKMATKKIGLAELRNLVKQVIRESGPSSDVDITITKNEEDERRPESGKKPSYSVDYVYTEGDSMIQFSGSLNPYHTGRDTEYEFEPSWFQDDESEQYYSENWEEIEDEILGKFYSM